MVILFLCVNIFSSIQSHQAMSPLVLLDGIVSECPLFILFYKPLCFMKHIPKTSDFNSIISVSSSHKLDLSCWLGLGVASVRGTFGLDCVLVLVFSGNLKNFILNDVE